MITKHIDDYIRGSVLFYDNRQIENDTKLDGLFTDNMNVKLQVFIVQTTHPILTKAGYTSCPSIEELKGYSEENLEHVCDFKIANPNGVIYWPGISDLRYVNLDDIIEITEEEIMMYEPNQVHEYLKPEQKSKLNKLCYLTLWIPQKLITKFSNEEGEVDGEQVAEYLSILCKKQSVSGHWVCAMCIRSSWRSTT